MQGQPLFIISLQMTNQQEHFLMLYSKEVMPTQGTVYVEDNYKCISQSFFRT